MSSVRQGLSDRRRLRAGGGKGTEGSAVMPAMIRAGVLAV